MFGERPHQYRQTSIIPYAFGFLLLLHTHQGLQQPDDALLAVRLVLFPQVPQID